MARKILPKEHHHLVSWAAMFGKPLDLAALRAAEETIPQGMVSLTVEERRRKGKSSYVLRSLEELKGNCGDNKMERYLDIGCPTGIQTLFRMRTGTLFLNSVASKWKRSLPSSCMACGNRDAFENLRHFLLECPALQGPREEWLQKWAGAAQLQLGSECAASGRPARATQLKPEGTAPDHDIHVMIGSIATTPGINAKVSRPLLEGQQAPKADPEKDEETRLLRARATGLSEMWKLRCSLQEARMRKHHTRSRPPSEPKSSDKAHSKCAVYE
jgi:hypothetical protein